MKDCYKRGCRTPGSLQEERGERPRRSEAPRKHCDEEAAETKQGQTDQLIKPDLGLLNKGGVETVLLYYRLSCTATQNGSSLKEPTQVAALALTLTQNLLLWKALTSNSGYLNIFLKYLAL